MLQLFQTRDGPFVFIVTLVYTCRTFFCCINKKYLSHILFWSQFVAVCFGMKFFSSFKIHCLQMLQLFQTRDGPFFFIVTLVYTCRAFFAVSSKNIYPIYCFGHSSSQSFLEWNSFPPLKYIVYKCYSCFRPGMGHFFHRHTCLHLSHFFCCIIKTYLSHILFWSQFISVCFGMKFFSSFKIHCLQMLQLFQTRDGPFFFIVTLVYTCRAFFAVSSRYIYPLYCFGHNSSQSVSEWNSFPPLKYIVYKCYSCFRPGMGHFFSSSHLSRFFCCIIKKYLSHILFWSQFVSVCFGMKFFSSFKIHCLQMLQLFQTRDGPFFSSSHLSTLVALFLLYHQEIFILYIVLVTVRLSPFRNEILFLL